MKGEFSNSGGVDLKSKSDTLKAVKNKGSDHL